MDARSLTLGGAALGVGATLLAWHSRVGRASSAQLVPSDLNQWLVEAQYAVRGPILDVANDFKRRLKAGEKLPFDELIYCNIGNPQSLGQKPLAFNREVLALVTNPALLESDKARALFAPDAVRRAEMYLKNIPNGLGAYTNSQGIEVIRQEVADFIERRDGFPADKDSIFLTDGASAGVRMLYQVMIDSGAGNDGMLVPIPQYPLYSALTTLFNANLVGYLLDEAQAWGVTVAQITSALTAARAKGIKVKAIVIINPGNPTGQCLSLDSMTEIVKLCARENLVLLADEVYQENVYDPSKEFISFKKLVRTMGAGTEAEQEAAKAVSLVSFHSTSKGFIGECGIRGGYFELDNLIPQVKEQLYKLASLTLCANTHGQITTGLMVNPPRKGEESFAEFEAQSGAILASLKRRANLVSTKLNELEGVSCNAVQGAMYAFPRIDLPDGALRKAREQGMEPDAYYCMAVLKNTGIVIVPGSGFKQAPGTFHFRTTFLPPEAKMESVMSRLAAYHTQFMAEHKDGKGEL